MTARHAARPALRTARASTGAPRALPSAPVIGSPSARSGRHPVPVARVLVPLVIRRWAASMGTTPRRLVGSVTAGLVLVAPGIRRVVGAWHPDGPAAGESGGSAEALLLAVTISLFFGVVAFGIFAARSRSLPRSLDVLHTLPVSARQVDRAGALPVLAVGGGLAIALLPTVGTVTTRLTGRGAVHAAFLLGLVVAGGAASGRVMLRVTERILPWPGTSSLRLTAAYLVWTFLLGLSLVVPSALLRWTDSSEGLLILTPLGWPLYWWVLVDPAPGVVAGAVVVTASLCWLARGLDPGSATTRGAALATRAAGDVRRVSFNRPFPLARFAARRLIRNPRALEAIVVSGFCALAVVVAVAWLSHRTRTSVGANVVALLGAQVAAGFAVAGRGLSSRPRPVEALLGLTPQRHLIALFAATLAVAVVTSAPSLLAVALFLPAGVVPSWLASLPVYVAVALLVSVTLTPESGNGASEAGALMVYAVASTAALTLLSRGSPVGAIPAGALLTMAALGASVAVERSHRRPA